MRTIRVSVVPYPSTEIHRKVLQKAYCLWANDILGWHTSYWPTLENSSVDLSFGPTLGQWRKCYNLHKKLQNGSQGKYCGFNLRIYRNCYRKSKRYGLLLWSRLFTHSTSGVRSKWITWIVSALIVHSNNTIGSCSYRASLHGARVCTIPILQIVNTEWVNAVSLKLTIGQISINTLWYSLLL